MSQSISPGQFAKPEDLVQQSNLAFYLLLRWLGSVIDLIALGVLVAAPFAIHAVVPGYVHRNPAYVATLFIWVAAAILYFSVRQAFWGRPRAQLLTGLAIIYRGGRPPGA